MCVAQRVRGEHCHAKQGGKEDASTEDGSIPLKPTSHPGRPGYLKPAWRSCIHHDSSESSALSSTLLRAFFPSPLANACVVSLVCSHVAAATRGWLQLQLQTFVAAKLYVRNRRFVFTATNVRLIVATTLLLELQEEEKLDRGTS